MTVSYSAVAEEYSSSDIVVLYRIATPSPAPGTGAGAIIGIDRVSVVDVDELLKAWSGSLIWAALRLNEAAISEMARIQFLGRNISSFAGDETVKT